MNNNIDLNNLTKEELIQIVLTLQELQKNELTGFFRRDKMKQISKELYTVAMIDINGLKGVNDTNGHEAGDKYILSVCDSIKKYIRKEDTVIRQGGDEFIIIFDNCTIEEVKMICKRITNTSCGIGQNKDLNEAIKEADENMYINKRNYYKSIA